MYLYEDKIVDWVISKDGFVLTRKINNINKVNYNICNLVCITGNNKTIKRFFNSLIKKFINKVTIIIIESDKININEEWLNNSRIKACFTWNKPFNHYKLYCLPIGLNYDRHYTELTEWINKKKIINKTKLLCFNCSVFTNKIRETLVYKINNEWSNFCDIIRYYKNKNEYNIKTNFEKKLCVNIINNKCYDEWIKYKFILSPPGAGIDCHRTWEAIIIGCIPIVISSTLNEIYKDLPILIVNSWNDINENFLEKKYNEIKNNKYNLDKIKLNYWIRKIDHICNYKVHFLTYSNNKFRKAKKRLLEEAKIFGEFETINGYGPSDLSKEFREKYNDILNMKRGGGYWIWRIEIIKQLLNKIKDNDYIVYLDAGCKLNKKGKKRYYEYIKMLSNTNYGILSFQMIDQLEKFWTTKQIFDYFNINHNDNIYSSGQYVGGVLILCKNDHLIKFINEFEKCINYDKFLITDKYNNLKQEKYFKDNRHDQSISSIIRKKIGSIVIKSDESWIPPFGKGASLKYPFWAIRSKI